MNRSALARPAFGCFAAVFAGGFARGTVRTLWLAARLGDRWAELVALPCMLFAFALLPWWVAPRRGSAERAP